METDVKKRLKIAKKWLARRIDINIPLPKNRLGKWLARDGHITPKYFRDSYAELKKVTWPSRKETWRLFIAVSIFAIVLAGLIAVVDFGFEKLVERLFL